MGARFLPRAADGAVTSSTAGSTTLDPQTADLLTQQLQQTQQQAQFKNTTDLLTLLAGLNNQNQVSPADVLAENRLEAGQAAGGYAPSAQYLEGMNPGGLADSFSKFLGKFGLGFSIEPGQREINRVPGISLDQATQAASAMNSQNGQTPGRYDDVIKQLLTPLIAQVMQGQNGAPLDNTQTSIVQNAVQQGKNLGSVMADMMMKARGLQQQQSAATQDANSKLQGRGIDVNPSAVLSALTGAGENAANGVGQAIDIPHLLQSLSGLRPGMGGP